MGPAPGSTWYLLCIVKYCMVSNIGFVTQHVWKVFQLLKWFGSFVTYLDSIRKSNIILSDAKGRTIFFLLFAWTIHMFLYLIIMYCTTTAIQHIHIKTHCYITYMHLNKYVLCRFNRRSLWTHIRTCIWSEDWVPDAIMTFSWVVLSGHTKNTGLSGSQTFGLASRLKIFWFLLDGVEPSRWKYERIYAFTVLHDFLLWILVICSDISWVASGCCLSDCCC